MLILLFILLFTSFILLFTLFILFFFFFFLIQLTTYRAGVSGCLWESCVPLSDTVPKLPRIPCALPALSLRPPRSTHKWKRRAECIPSGRLFPASASNRCTACPHKQYWGPVGHYGPLLGFSCKRQYFTFALQYTFGDCFPPGRLWVGERKSYCYRSHWLFCKKMSRIYYIKPQMSCKKF